MTDLELKGVAIAYLCMKGTHDPNDVPHELDAEEHSWRLHQVGIPEGSDLTEVARGYAAFFRGEVPQGQVHKAVAEALRPPEGYIDVAEDLMADPELKGMF